MNTHEPALLSGSADARLTVLATGSETGGVFALVTLTLQPHDAGPPLHYHPAQSEGYYVVAGTLALTCDDRTTTMTAGMGALVPPGVTHACWNPTATPTIVLLIYRPGITEVEALALAAGMSCEQGNV